MDLGIEVILELFSKTGLQKVFTKSISLRDSSENSQRIFALREEYIKTVDQVVLFLQNQNATLARQICSMNFLPEASRFNQLDDLEFAFGNMGLQDKAKHLSTLYLEDISDYIVENIDADFGFSRYAERIGQSANSFDELYLKLKGDNSFIDDFTLKILQKKIEIVQPKLVCFSVPFPGNLYSAFKSAQFIKSNYPDIKIAMGGGFPNTELRELKDIRVFEFFDFISLDDGELPLELVCENLIQSKEISESEFKRTFILENGEIIYKNNSKRADYKQAFVGTPDYSDLYLEKYISVIEIANPMHSLWSDGRWNKLTMAHGCYWGKCTFCDISLDYIKTYEPISAKILVDRMQELIVQTGESGFHFVDEAAPPALMREVALEILRRNLVVTWWTNIRFEKSFSKDLCFLLKISGCVAVSGGLEVASDRLLKLIDKGVSVEQVAKVTRNFTEAGIMVHSYLMYGFPTQTVQETVDSLEMVRQLFEMGIIQSGFWHQFAMTAHSPVGMYPEKFGVVKETEVIGTFANNDINYIDSTGIDHDKFSFGLKKSLFNFMHGICFDYELQDWFEFKIPKTKIPEDYIFNALEVAEDFKIKSTAKIVWLGGKPSVDHFTKSKKGNTWETPKKKYSSDKIKKGVPEDLGQKTMLTKEMMTLTFHDKKESFTIQTNKQEGEWLVEMLLKITVSNAKTYSFQEVKADFETKLEDFELFWYSKPINTLREFGLLVL